MAGFQTADDIENRVDCLGCRERTAFLELVLLVIFVLNFFVSLKLSENFEQKITAELKSSAVLVGEVIRNDLAQSRQAEIQSRAGVLAEKLNCRIKEKTRIPRLPDKWDYTFS